MAHFQSQHPWKKIFETAAAVSFLTPRVTPHGHEMTRGGRGGPRNIGVCFLDLNRSSWCLQRSLSLSLSLSLSQSVTNSLNLTLFLIFSFSHHLSFYLSLSLSLSLPLSLSLCTLSFFQPHLPLSLLSA